MAQPSITLHWLDHSRAQRIVWLLEELGLEYDIKPYQRVQNRAPPELKKVSPLSKSPVLEINYADGKKKILIESAHIISYLIRNFDTGKKLVPENEDDSDDIEFYTHWCEGSLQPLLTFLVVLRTAASRAPFYAKIVIDGYNSKVFELYNIPEVVNSLDYLESKFDGEGFIVGKKLSAADIMLSFPVAEICLLGDRVPLDKSKYPKLQRWAKEITDRPAYKIATGKTAVYEKQAKRL